MDPRTKRSLNRYRNTDSTSALPGSCHCARVHTEMYSRARMVTKAMTVSSSHPCGCPDWHCYRRPPPQRQMVPGTKSGAAVVTTTLPLLGVGNFNQFRRKTLGMRTQASTACSPRRAGWSAAGGATTAVATAAGSAVAASGSVPPAPIPAGPARGQPDAARCRRRARRRRCRRQSAGCERRRA